MESNIEKRSTKQQLLRCIFLASIFVLPNLTGVAQSITIGEGSVDPNAVLNVTSSDQGLLIPRMTSGQRAAIGSPANGLMVYDTERKSFFYYNGREGWVEMRPVPAGTITMWYGDVATYFPGGIGVGRMKGWAIYGALAGRFVMGGALASIGGSGGAEFHELTWNEMPSHSHSVSDPGHSHGASLGSTAHAHTLTYRSSGTSATNAVADDGSNYTHSGDVSDVDYDVTTGDATYSASISPASAGITLASSGSGQAHDTRPPFLVLVYIVKL